MTTEMLAVKIIGVSVTDIGFVIFLKNTDREKVLPIFIGPVEAQAISMASLGKKTKRPLTHELIERILSADDLTIAKVEIIDFKEETYFADLYLQKSKQFEKQSDKDLLKIDCRPSDAIVLALKFKRSIYVSRHILEENGILLKEKKNELENARSFSSGTITKKMNEQLGMYEKMLKDAINEERYEDATRIKGEIDSLIGGGN